ncbi:hypothetical protein TKK_0018251 [Trichogramma kaykai]|uniref:Ribosomal protein S10 domain-containing protein n=1 Tax=Trichogramma kaykai TaxID=54128 RepID=A0ABD2VZR9_9HYME
MRLTAFLCFGKRPHGIKYRGKYRQIKPITNFDLLTMRHDFDRTEKNMFYLRHPYLTVEQSFGHSKSPAEKYSKFIKKILHNRNQDFEKHTTLAEVLAPLKVSEAWD